MDVTQTGHLLHGQEKDVFLDASYPLAEKRTELTVAKRELLALNRQVAYSIGRKVRKWAETGRKFR